MIRITKTIKIDNDKCTGCKTCEMICSAFHAEPKYSIVNFERSRIRVYFDEENGIYNPVFAGPFTEAKCNTKRTYIIKGREYGVCSFCPASCPSRDLFKEPDSSLPLKCDLCGDPPPPEGPLCVKWCLANALTYWEKEEEEQEEEEKVEEKD